MGIADYDLYFYPEKFGLTTVGEVEWNGEPYQFDVTVVWRDHKGRYYMA